MKLFRFLIALALTVGPTVVQAQLSRGADVDDMRRYTYTVTSADLTGDVVTLQFPTTMTNVRLYPLSVVIAPGADCKVSFEARGTAATTTLVARTEYTKKNYDVASAAGVYIDSNVGAPQGVVTPVNLIGNQSNKISLEGYMFPSGAYDRRTVTVRSVNCTGAGTISFHWGEKP